MNKFGAAGNRSKPLNRFAAGLKIVHISVRIFDGMQLTKSLYALQKGCFYRERVGCGASEEQGDEPCKASNEQGSDNERNTPFEGHSVCNDDPKGMIPARV